MTADRKFESMGLVLPPHPKPLGLYKPFLQVRNNIYVSGHGSVNSDGTIIRGQVGPNFDKELGKKAAHQTGLAIISTLFHHIGTLNRIERVIKIMGMVNTESGFEDHPYIIDGCSELFKNIWGEDNGVGVRSAIGVASLPQNIPVEIEAQFLLKS